MKNIAIIEILLVTNQIVLIKYIEDIAQSPMYLIINNLSNEI